MSKTFAIISESIVSNVIVADSVEIAETITGQPCVEYTETNPAQIGWVYDSETGKFSLPVEEAPAE